MYARNRVKSLVMALLPVVGILCLAALAGVMWWWESTGRQNYLYDEMLVLNTPLKRGEVLDINKLDTIKIDSSKKVDDTVIDPDEIVGLAAKHYIPANTPLVPYYFEKKDLITDGVNRLVKIPNDWIYSVPNTIRMHDRVYFYEMIVEKEQKPNTVPANPNMQNTNPDNSISTFSKAEETQMKSMVGKIILEATVGFVKDGANREVVSIRETDRLDGSSAVKDIEIVITEEQFQLLEESVKRGNKFVLMYSETGGTEAE